MIFAWGLLTLALVGIVSVLARSDSLTAYGQGEMMAPWLLVWVSAALCLTYDGSARGGVRMTTVVLMTLMVLPTVTRLGEAESTGPFLEAAVRIVLGARPRSCEVRRVQIARCRAGRGAGGAQWRRQSAFRAEGVVV